MSKWANCPPVYDCDQFRTLTDEELEALWKRHPDWLSDIKRESGYDTDET